MTPADLARIVADALTATDPEARPDRDALRARSAAVASVLAPALTPAQLDEAAALLERMFATTFGPDTLLTGDDDRWRPWLAHRKFDTPFLDRYRTHLTHHKAWSPRIVARLIGQVDAALDQLMDPEAQGPWDRRGLVVGRVQSGKTSHYTGLICKAVDAGYNIIVVLAGLHNSLRSQTQQRLDEGFLGYDTRRMRDARDARDQTKRGPIGVGLRPNPAGVVAQTLTTSAERGDFSRKIADHCGLIPRRGHPVLLVVKKNASTLKNLNGWIDHLRCNLPGQALAEQALLVIDDESDNASVNTRKADDDPTTINREIRGLLERFERSAYVGYTATPFANIFIPPDTADDPHAEDLFPRDFILNLDSASDYLGPIRLFGLKETLGPRGAAPGLPLIHQVTDADLWTPPKHKKDWPVPEAEFPPSLAQALDDFLLACAARRARGQRDVHNSMLIHVTRFTATQERVTRQIRDHLLALRDGIELNDPTTLRRLRARWESHFLPTTRRLAAEPDAGPPHPWPEIEAELWAAARRCEVRTISGTAGDALTYWDHPQGLNVIAVGGDKLSRGLTLEGLTVSYFLRASRAYDTLMQMGRWFGYRPGHLDLCRLYTTPDLAWGYEHIALAEEELRAELDHMSQTQTTPRATPRDWGLRVRTLTASSA